MEKNVNDTSNGQWVSERMAILPGIPGWEPNSDRALEQWRRRARRPEGRSQVWLWAAGGVAALIVALILPSTLAIAQRLWDRQSLAGVAVARWNPEERLLLAEAALPLTYVMAPQLPQPVSSLAEAARQAGFTPRVPIKLSVRSMGALILRDPIGAPLQILHWGKAALTNPKITVTGRVIAQTTIQVSNLNSALRAAGVHGVTVPQSWDGASIGIEFSPAVIAQYDVVQLAQSLPYSLAWPNGFPVADFVETVLQILGLTAPDARSIRDSFLENPVYFAFIPPEGQIQVREVEMGMGPLRNPWKGILFEDAAVKQRASESILVWSTPDRIYALKGRLTEDDLIAIAHSIL